MTNTRSSLSIVLPLIALLAVGLACNQSGEQGTNKATTASPAANSSAASADLSGTYDITGTNEGGGGAYRGSLIITDRDDVYQFSWDTAGKKYDGVGVRTDNTIGVAFADGTSGEGCGVVLYKIGSDGTLDGKAGYWGNNSQETETAKRTKGTDLEGSYDVKGTNTGGDAYEGKLNIAKSGAGYTFSWAAGTSFKGFGVRQGDMVAAGFGGKQCGFVSYERKADGTLEGKWGGYGSTAVGTETAKKK